MKILTAVLISVLIFSAAGCDRDNNQEPKYRFTLVTYDSPGNPFWTKVCSGANEMAEKLGCVVDIQYAKNDPVRENDIIETAITNKVDGIGVVLNYDDAYDEVVKKAVTAGIPVLCFNTDDSQGKEGNARMCYIGQNLETAGSIIAERLIKDGGLKKGDHVVCPVEHPEAVYAVKRYAGAKRVFDKNGLSSEILNTGAVSLEETLNRLTQYLLGHKNTNAVLALGGMPMEMAPQAVEEARMKIPTAGFDLTRQIIENIINGKTIAAIDQQPFYQGSMTVLQLYYTKKYNMIPCDVDTGGGLVDKSNAQKMLELADKIR